MKNNNSVTVHFCDFGDYDVMSCKNLQNLTTPFLEVPYNALKARLGGKIKLENFQIYKFII